MEGVIRPPSWQARARCAKVEDPDIFHPHRGESLLPARNVCHKCPVKQECLEFAVDERITYGVWGGMSPPERKRWALQNGKEADPVEDEPLPRWSQFDVDLIDDVSVMNAGATTAPLASASA